MRLPMLSAEDKLAEIRRLYFRTTRQTIQEDLTRALDLLKSMNTEEERERATVYMEGLAQMRSDWGQANVKREKFKGKTKKSRLYHSVFSHGQKCSPPLAFVRPSATAPARCGRPTAAASRGCSGEA